MPLDRFEAAGASTLALRSTVYIDRPVERDGYSSFGHVITVVLSKV